MLSCCGSQNQSFTFVGECMVTNWEPWSLCSATCGKGIRMRSRVYVFPIKAQMFRCHRQTIERQFCNAEISECQGCLFDFFPMLLFEFTALYSFEFILLTLSFCANSVEIIYLWNSYFMREEFRFGCFQF